MTAKIAICQYATILGDKEHNVNLSLEWLDRAGSAGVAMVVLPELITTGYGLGDAALDLAEPVPGSTTELWAGKAIEYGYYIVAGLCRCDENVPGLVYNSAVLIGPTGQLEGLYNKIVPPLYLSGWPGTLGQSNLWHEAEFYRRGNSLPVFKTDIGTVGIQICQDAVYPEFTRVQVFKGAQIIIQLFNGVAIPTNHEADITPLLTRVHAYDNTVYIIMANKCGQETFEYGGSTYTYIFRGESHIADPQGNIVGIAAPEAEEMLLADIDPQKVTDMQWRMKFMRDWRSDLMRPLCEVP